MGERPQKSSKENVKVYYPEELDSDKDPHFIKPSDRCFIPKKSFDLIHHRYFSLGYNEDMEQAMWVAYALTRSSLNERNVPRVNWYMEDGLIETGSANYYDFKNKKYTRGHLAPAADMAFNKLAMKESFLMSNMSPQDPYFNRGVWNELEQNVRRWAHEKNELLVITGPVFYDEDVSYIGTNKVAVPHAFYKVLLDLKNEEGIGFIIPNSLTDVPLESFAYTIDDCEEYTGLDFFPECYESHQDETRVESESNIQSWSFDKNIYQRRVDIWNKD